MEKYSKTFPHYETGEPVTVWVSFTIPDSSIAPWYADYLGTWSDGTERYLTNTAKDRIVGEITSDGYTLGD